MFEIELTQEEDLVRDTARRFAREVLLPDIRANEAARGVPDSVLDRFRAAGLEALDGAVAAGEDERVSATLRALILEELGAVDPGAAISLDGLGCAGYWLTENDLPNSARRGVVIIDEERRFGVEGDLLSGHQPWIAADEPDVVVVAQRDVAWVVTDGIECEPIQVCGLEGAGSARLVLRDVPIRARIDGAGAIAHATARTQLSTAALLVGCARGAYEYARDYACEREAFGRPIAHHQALAFLIVEMAMAIEAARVLLWRAAIAVDEGEETAFWGNAALAEAAEQALFVGPAAVQVLGGHGFVRDYPVEKAMRDIRTLVQMVGGRDRADLELGELVREREARLY